MGHFAAAEADAGLDLVAALEELLGLLDADVEVGDVDLGGQANFLDIHHFLVLAGFLFLLGLLKAELTVVHHAAHGGLSLGGDLHQIQTALNGGIHGLLNGNDTQLGTVAVDQSNFLIKNLFVNLMLQSANVRTPPKKSKNGRQKCRPNKRTHRSLLCLWNTELLTSSNAMEVRTASSALFYLIYYTREIAGCQALFSFFYRQKSVAFPTVIYYNRVIKKASGRPQNYERRIRQ